MTTSRKSRERIKARKQFVKDQRQQMRDIFGYTKLKEAGLKSSRPEFPDLREGLDRGTPCSNTVGNGFAKPPLPDDAKTFPVGVSHKQGYQLITASDDLKDMGGRKT